MSIEVCQECDTQIDTDYNVEGQYISDYGFVCEDCINEEYGGYDE